MAAAAGATTTSIVLHPGRRELMLGFISKVRVRDVGISVSWKHYDQALRRLCRSSLAWLA